MLRPRWHLCAVAVAVATVVGFVPPAAGGAGCGQVSRDYRYAEGGSGVQIVRKQGLTCAAARRVAAACAGNIYPPAGWRASTSRSGRFFFLRSGRRSIVLRGVAGGPPGCAQRTARRPAGLSRNPGTLTPSGLIRVRVGQTPAAAERASGLYFELVSESACRRSLAVRGVSIEVTETGRRITAVLVTRRGIRTSEGAQVGDDASRLAAVYPGALKASGQLPGGGRRLAFTPGDGGRSIVFWLDRSDRVTRMVAGAADDVTRRDEFCA
jgi:hypothetical protein